MQRDILSRRRHHERGQTIILVAISLVSLLAMAALAIDIVSRSIQPVVRFNEPLTRLPWWALKHSQILASLHSYSRTRISRPCNPGQPLWRRLIKSMQCCRTIWFLDRHPRCFRHP